MTDRIAVYETQISLGDETITVLTTTPSKTWEYEYYVADDPIGYLELKENPSDL